MNNRIKLTETGNIDIYYYQRQAELARARAVRELAVAVRNAVVRRLSRLPRILPHFDLTRHAH